MTDDNTPGRRPNEDDSADESTFRAGRHALPDDAPAQTGPIPIVGDSPPVYSDELWKAPPGGRHEAATGSNPSASSSAANPVGSGPGSVGIAPSSGAATAVAERSRAEAEPKPRKRSEGKTAERRLAFWLVAPAALMMLLVTGYPIIYAVWLSLNKMSLSAPGEREFVWFSNYATVLTDNYWWTAFGVTVGITVVSVLIELVLGMAIALVMHRTIFGRGTIRTVVLIPYGIVTVAAAFSWYYAWTPGTGYLANLLPDGSAPLTEQWPSLAIIVLAEVWKTTPFMALLLLAGLALVPDDLLKAAQVDGAGAWTRLWRIILPLMKPAILVALLFRTLDAFRVFDNIYVLTSGSNNTYSVSMLGYDNLFGAFNLGVGSAISILIFVCVAIIAFVFIKGFGTAAPGSDDEGR
ncbi:sugar ABC transporter permease [Gordonia rubripertincta]|uniref:Sugar ABC transporter permease n=1 Tax=Gordonia rubripertincta TaxID=36822 RepID=A0AAW4G3E4_GORRU|nr:sugar ABC transporter permease [Gordonia rubripertincta]MBM7277620.1 sugar ABC transporter permease [Gordonia rubripertincta]QMU20251.1 sugar ABC transporter permease [Gordonia rubripertincta]